MNFKRLSLRIRYWWNRGAFVLGLVFVLVVTILGTALFIVTFVKPASTLLILSKSPVFMTIAISILISIIYLWFSLRMFREYRKRKRSDDLTVTIDVDEFNRRFDLSLRRAESLKLQIEDMKKRIEESNHKASLLFHK
jgi:hypothetical protein